VAVEHLNDISAIERQSMDSNPINNSNSNNDNYHHDDIVEAQTLRVRVMLQGNLIVSNKETAVGCPSAPRLLLSLRKNVKVAEALREILRSKDVFLYYICSYFGHPKKSKSLLHLHFGGNLSTVIRRPFEDDESSLDIFNVHLSLIMTSSGDTLGSDEYLRTYADGSEIMDITVNATASVLDDFCITWEEEKQKTLVGQKRKHDNIDNVSKTSSETSKKARVDVPCGEAANKDTFDNPDSQKVSNSVGDEVPREELENLVHDCSDSSSMGSVDRPSEIVAQDNVVTQEDGEMKGRGDQSSQIESTGKIDEIQMEQDDESSTSASMSSKDESTTVPGKGPYEENDSKTDSSQPLSKEMVATEQLMTDVSKLPSQETQKISRLKIERSQPSPDESNLSQPLPKESKLSKTESSQSSPEDNESSKTDLSKPSSKGTEQSKSVTFQTHLKESNIDFSQSNIESLKLTQKDDDDGESSTSTSSSSSSSSSSSTSLSSSSSSSSSDDSDSEDESSDSDDSNSENEETANAVTNKLYRTDNKKRKATETPPLSQASLVSMSTVTENTDKRKHPPLLPMNLAQKLKAVGKTPRVRSKSTKKPNGTIQKTDEQVTGKNDSKKSPFSSFTVRELREMCKDKGLPSTGKKTELLKRIEKNTK